MSEVPLQAMAREPDGVDALGTQKTVNARFWPWPEKNFCSNVFYTLPSCLFLGEALSSRTFSDEQRARQAMAREPDGVDASNAPRPAGVHPLPRIHLRQDSVVREFPRESLGSVCVWV